MKHLFLVVAAGLGLAGCNAASGVDLNKNAYTSCLDQAVGAPGGSRAQRNASVQRAFKTCQPQERELVAAAAAAYGGEIGSKAVADGKAAYARRMVSGR